MDAGTFNQQFENTVTLPLAKLGFRLHGQCLSYTKEQTELALLRFQMKFSGLTQKTHFLLCVRHVFLRTLEKETANEFLPNVNEYPFKLPVSKLSPDVLKRWRYEPINLGPREYDTIQFGKLTDASPILSSLKEKVMHFGLAWMGYLTPAEALNQLKKHGENACCEKIWIEDYEAFLNNGSR